MSTLNFPIGEYCAPSNELTESEINQCIDDIEQFPVSLRKAVDNLTDKQLDTPYRPEGWTIRQLVNHCSDSHINALMRVKLALTENNPSILPYDQDKWANLVDSTSIEISAALNLLDGLHERWAFLLKSLSEEQWNSTFYHPEHDSTFGLKEAIHHYAWHCRHHLAHAINLSERNGW